MEELELGRCLVQLQNHVDGSSLGPKDCRALIDGWSGVDCGMDCVALMEGTLGVGDSTWTKRRRVIRRYEEIGVVTEDGLLRWLGWKELVERTSLPIDFVRMLGKGSTYRLGKKPLTRIIKGRGRVLRGCEDQVCDPNSGIPMHTFEAIGKALTTPAEFLWMANSVSGDKLRAFIERLRGWGWVIRKEDRGPRLVLTSLAWERSRVKAYIPTVGNVVEATIRPESRKTRTDKDDKDWVRVPRLYMIPKTGKAGRMKGRPVVSFIQASKYPRKFVRRVGRQIHEWIMARAHKFDVVRVDEGVRAHGGSKHGPMLIGDIVSMFTAVPHEFVREWLEQSDFTTYARIKIPGGELLSPQEISDLILDMVSGFTWQYEGTCVYVNSGLPMGYWLSPALARAVVCWRTRELAKAVDEAGDLVCTEYVDDVGVSTVGWDQPERRTMLLRSLEDFRRSYEEAIYPMEMEWQERRRLLDAYFPSEAEKEERRRESEPIWARLTGHVPQERLASWNLLDLPVHRFEQTKPIGILAEELPEAMRTQVLAAEVRRRVARSSKQTDITPNENGTADPGTTARHVQQYLSRQRQLHTRGGLEAWLSRAMLPRQRGKPPRMHTVQIPYTSYFRTDLGRAVWRHMREKFTSEATLGPGQQWPGQTVRFIMMSHRITHMICSKGRHYEIRSA